jgi:hypothetical protein
LNIPKIFVAALAIVALATAAAQAAVVINEIDADSSAMPDTEEFIELHGPPNTMLNGLVVVLMNGANDLSYAAYDLDGWQTGATGYFLLGNALVSPTPDIVFPNITLHNGADAVALYSGSASDFPNGTPATTTNLLDAIVYGNPMHSADAGLLTALGESTQYVDTPATSISRVPDGMSGDFTNGTNPMPMNSGIPQVPEPASLALLLIATSFAVRMRVRGR